MNPNFNIFLVKNNLLKASPKGECLQFRWINVFFKTIFFFFLFGYNVTIEHPKRDLTINDDLFIIPVKKQCPLFILWLPLVVMNRNLAKLTQNRYFSYEFFFKKQGIMCKIPFPIFFFLTTMQNFTWKKSCRWWWTLTMVSEHDPY